MALLTCRRAAPPVINFDWFGRPHLASHRAGHQRVNDDWSGAGQRCALSTEIRP